VVCQARNEGLQEPVSLFWQGFENLATHQNKVDVLLVFLVLVILNLGLKRSRVSKKPRRAAIALAEIAPIILENLPRDNPYELPYRSPRLC
jgi:hypothetical protein